MFGKALRRAALCRTSQLDRVLVTSKDAIGGASVGPLLLLLSVGIGVARAEEAKPVGSLLSTYSEPHASGGMGPC
jgi:hypothetical protein